MNKRLGCFCFLVEHREMEKQYPTNYPSDVSDEEWAFVAPYLALCREDAQQREYPLRSVFNALIPAGIVASRATGLGKPGRVLSW